MPTLQLTVKSSGIDPFDVDIDSEETVEALGIVAYSMKLELGEDLRVVHKAKILAPDLSLAAAGVSSGDVVAIARRAPAHESAQILSTSSKNTPPISDDVVDQSAPLAHAVNATSQPEPQVAASPAAAEPSAATALADSIKEASAKSTVATETVDAHEPTVVSMPAVVEQSELEDVEIDGAAKAVTDTADIVDQAAVGSALTIASAAAQDAEAEAHVEDDDESFDDVSPESLRSLAQRLECENGVPQGEAARLVRRAAARVEMLQGVVGELGQSLQVVNFLSARTLRGLEGRLSSSPPSAAVGAAAEVDGDSGRSFLVKRGDADIQEAHRALNLKRPSSSGPCSWAGTLESQASAKKPKTKEEMDQARRDRLDQLEAQQAAKKKQILEADAKSAATKAMFEKRDQSKPLGKF